ncbi:Reversal of tor2 lethality, partial [Maublancomyces gigas]
MPLPATTSLWLLVCFLAPPTDSLNNVTSLTGTWSSKSNTVFTGPDFYDPVIEDMKEPRLTGTSFSFTDDGYFEEALYLVISNPTSPSCPKAIMQWQHGRYEIAENGSLILNPIAVDGRQLLSDPCKYSSSIYTRFSITEIYNRWEIFIDKYRGKYRLGLYRFDGSPMNPLYLAYRPPKILPTETLNPTTTTPEATGASKSNLKRSQLPDLRGA